LLGFCIELMHFCDQGTMISNFNFAFVCLFVGFFLFRKPTCSKIIIIMRFPLFCLALLCCSCFCLSFFVVFVFFFSFFLATSKKKHKLTKTTSPQFVVHFLAPVSSLSPQFVVHKVKNTLRDLTLSPSQGKKHMRTEREEKIKKKRGNIFLLLLLLKQLQK